jgi:hypothetical protein
MPDKVRYIQRKDERFDEYLRDLITAKGFGHERHYAGLVTQEEADEIRRKLRSAGKHLGVSVRVFWEPCGKPGRCPAGGSCGFHVRYTAFRTADARAFKTRQARRSA